MPWRHSRHSPTFTRPRLYAVTLTYILLNCPLKNRKNSPSHIHWLLPTIRTTTMLESCAGRNLENTSAVWLFGFGLPEEGAGDVDSGRWCGWAALTGRIANTDLMMVGLWTILVSINGCSQPADNSFSQSCEIHVVLIHQPEWFPRLHQSYFFHSFDDINRILQ